MRKELLIAFRITLVLTLLTGGVYPLVVWGVGQLLFHDAAEGSFITRDGQPVGSALIGQPFAEPAHFHSRPSAAGGGYDATASSGSNLGPTSAKLADQVKANIAAYRSDNPAATSPLPADAVTASGSGLDPHISPENARLQIPRVAAAAGLSVDTVTALVEKQTEGRWLGLWGEPRVNVLRLNLAVDDLRAAGAVPRG